MKVSVIVPCYNQAEYLDECLQSVLSQSYKDWECIIVNDGSPDNTEEIANIFLKLDSRFKYIKIENGGVSNARNVGIEKANGKYILPLDADDKIASSYLELGLNEFEKDKTLKVVYCEVVFFGKHIKPWKLPSYSFSELLRNNIIICSALFKKESFVKIGGYDKNLSKGLEDWEFWINLLKDEGKVYRIPKVCFYYRVKDISRNSGISEDEFEAIVKYISIKHAELYVNNFGSYPFLLAKNIELMKENKRLIKANKVNLALLIKKLKHYFYG